jgi:hypothetical protein
MWPLRGYSLEWRLSLSNIQQGEYPSNLAHKLKRMWEIQKGEPRSQSSRGAKGIGLFANKTKIAIKQMFSN